MIPEAQAEIEAICSRHLKDFVAFVAKWPNFREHAAYALLGAAIATVDMMGGDAEKFLRDLRGREPKPAPLVPPKGN